MHFIQRKVKETKALHVQRELHCTQITAAKKMLVEGRAMGSKILLRRVALKRNYHTKLHSNIFMYYNYCSKWWELMQWDYKEFFFPSVYGKYRIFIHKFAATWRLLSWSPKPQLSSCQITREQSKHKELFIFLITARDTDDLNYSK